ncbi:MAG: protein translocase subunit SecF [Acidimicrobiales bacterium]
MTDPIIQERGLFGRLYHGETAFDFVGQRLRFWVLSCVVIGVGMAAFGFNGLNLGIDFKGGTSWEVPAAELSVADTRTALQPFGLADAKVQQLGRGADQAVRVQASTVSEEVRNDVREALAEVGGVDAGLVSVNEVGPTWGSDISSKALRALVSFLIAIAIYISLRFEWKMAIATLAALVHDLLVTVGVYAIVGFEVTPATVIATLTILGYSIYDGIVVFDRIEENTRGMAASGRMTYADMVTLSLNQMLMRSINTSLTSLLPVFSLLVIGAGFLGAVTLQDFALALFIGLTASTYSSIFVAAPILAVLKEREPRYAAIKTRLSTRSGTVLTPAAAAASAGGGADSVEADAGGSKRPNVISSPRTGQAPRPRKKGKRR